MLVFYMLYVYMLLMLNKYCIVIENLYLNVYNNIIDHAQDPALTVYRQIVIR